MTVQEEKKNLRRRIRQIEEGMTPKELADSDKRLIDRLRTLPEFVESKTVMLFYPFGREPQIMPLLEKLYNKKRICLPAVCRDGRMISREYTEGSGLEKDCFGIWKPDGKCREIPSSEIDFILVPAVCYDRQRFRLGRGKGNYDRFLQGYTGITAGLCRERCLQKRIPREEHDLGVQFVITEEELFREEGR